MDHLLLTNIAPFQLANGTGLSIRLVVRAARQTLMMLPRTGVLCVPLAGAAKGTCPASHGCLEGW